MHIIEGLVLILIVFYSVKVVRKKAMDIKNGKGCGCGCSNCSQACPSREK